MSYLVTDIAAGEKYPAVVRERTINEALELVKLIQAQADKEAIAEDDNVWLRVRACLEMKAEHIEFTFSKLVWLRSNYGLEQLIDYASSHDKQQELMKLWESQRLALTAVADRRNKLDSQYYKVYSRLALRYNDKEHPAVETQWEKTQEKLRQNRKIDVDAYFLRMDKPDVDTPPYGKGWETWDEECDGRGKAPANLAINIAIGFCPLLLEECKDILEIFADPETFLGERTSLRHLPKDEPTDEEPTRIVLVGKTGCGKSSLINAVAGSSMFTTIGGRSTKEINLVEGEWQTLDGEVIKFSMVDTPGLADTAFDDDDTRRALAKYFTKETRANLILFVTTEPEYDTCNSLDTAHLVDYRKIFGELAFKTNFAVIIKKWKAIAIDPKKRKKAEHSRREESVVRRSLQSLYDIFSGHVVISKFFFVDDNPVMSTGSYRATHEALDALMRYARSLDPVETIYFKQLLESEEVNAKIRSRYKSGLSRFYNSMEKPPAEHDEPVLTLCDQTKVSTTMLGGVDETSMNQREEGRCLGTPGYDAPHCCRVIMHLSGGT
jgi:GTP-binding protein EngB required for normal cell division